MRATPSIRSLRRAVTAAAAMLTCAAALVTVAPPAAAAVAPPWKFINSTGGSVTVSAGATSAVTATCPGGYIPIGGGLSSYYTAGASFERVAEYRTASGIGYSVVVHNYEASDVDF